MEIKKTIKIIIADDHPLFLKGLKDTLNEELDFEIVGTANNGLEALELIKTLTADVLLSDLDMPFLNGIELVKTIKQNKINIKTILLSMHKSEDIRKAAFAIGVDGYVFKDDVVDELVLAIRTVFSGGNYKSNQTEFAVNSIDQLIQTDVSLLTRMELKILQLIGEQHTTKQIAESNFISIKTVENHRANISKKLNLKGNNNLIKYALSLQQNFKI